jgi:hypothetical protein
MRTQFSQSICNCTHTLCTVADDVGESLCSLRFAERVRKVELGKAEKQVSKGNRN